MIDGTTVLTDSAVLGKSFDTDGALGGGSATDSAIPTQLAVKTAIDNATQAITAIGYFIAAM